MSTVISRYAIINSVRVSIKVVNVRAWTDARKNLQMAKHPRVVGFAG